MTNAAIKKYCRAVAHCMTCSPSTKRRLLGSLRDELSEQPGESYERLVSEHGTPEETAAALQETVGYSEERRSRSARWLAPALVALLTLLAVAAVSGVILRVGNDREPVYREIQWSTTAEP